MILIFLFISSYLSFSIFNFLIFDCKFIDSFLYSLTFFKDLLIDMIFGIKNKTVNVEAVDIPKTGLVYFECRIS